MFKSKKGVSLVELGIYIAIAAVIFGFIGMSGYNLYQNSKDTGIGSDLKALTDATQLYMVDTNGATPCFTPELSEGSAAADLSGTACANLGYDYIQGSSTANIDFDDVTGEKFTFDNILAPGYISAIPSPQRAGENYFFTTGNPSTSAGATAFAYTAKLGGNKADTLVDNNVSIINAIASSAVDTTVSDYKDESLLKNCTPSEVNFTPGTALTAGSGVDTTINPATYYVVDQLTQGGTNSLLAGGCDLYSTGNNITGGNFTDAQSGADQSMTITVNAK